MILSFFKRRPSDKQLKRETNSTDSTNSLDPVNYMKVIASKFGILEKK